MSVVLTIICHASTEAIRKAAFPLDEPLDARGLAKASAMAGTIARVDAAWTSPKLRAVQTAAAMRIDAATDSVLDDTDYGVWAGRTLDEVAASDATGVASWLTDAEAAPHGGEPVAGLFRRIEPWLGRMCAGHGRVVAVTHSAVARATLVIALDAPYRSFWRVELAPLAQVKLRGDAGRWTLLSAGTDRGVQDCIGLPP